MRRLLDEISEAVVVVDRASEVVLYNRPFERLAGLELSGELPPPDLRRALAAVIGPVEAQILAAELLSEPGPSSTTIELPAGRAVAITTTPLELERPNDHLLVSLREVTHEHRQLRELEHRALHDRLTGLPNRELIVDRLQQALTRQAREGRAVGVIFVDLDGFKDVNDRYGHAAGDLVLIEVGNRLQRAARHADTVGRLGGDEYLVVCDGLGDSAVLDAICARMEHALDRPIELDKQAITPYASLGAAFVQNPAASANQVIERADALMYQAKRRGSNREARSEPRARGTAEADPGRWLRDAIETEQLWFAYLPVVALDSEQVIAVEALVRCRHPKLAHSSPQELLALAEQARLVSQFTAWCLNAAAAAIGALRQSTGRSVPVILNLSGAQLADESLPSDAAEVARRHGVPPSAFSFDIAERTIVAGQQQLERTLQPLRALECQLFADDVTGPVAAAELISELGFTGLKLDRKLVSAAVSDRQAANAAGALTARARDLGLDTLGEGVGDENRLRVVRELGCDAAQGFAFYGRPRPLSKLRALIN
ncbi:MAG: putative bifunctional diguanylate cyclase/phosphodiesterase [Solirubrobacteraceae bacterium]